MHTALKATVSGRVQGVTFRDFTRRKALSLRLVGEVENLPDGTVRIYAEGEEETLNRFIEFLQKGPIFSRVDNVAYQWTHPKGAFDSFRILYT